MNKSGNGLSNEGILGSGVKIHTDIKTPNKGRNRNGSTTEMAVDQLQASEKLIAGILK